MNHSPTPYMRPDTAQALLALSRKRTAALRAARVMRQQLIALGWEPAAANELALIGYRARVVA